MTRLILALAFAVLTTAALAQFLNLPIGPGSIVNIGPSTSSSGSPGPPPVACNAGQLDFSDACNTTQYMVILK